jgi:hypothetical protein
MGSSLWKGKKPEKADMLTTAAAHLLYFPS